MKTLQQFISNLNARERIVLGLGLLVTIALLVYALLLEPWYRELTRLREAVPQKMSDLAWMERHVGVVRRLRSGGTRKQAEDVNILNVVEKTAAASRVPIRQINPGPEGEVKIWFRETDFDPWLLWLEELKKQGIEVTAVSIDRTPEDKVDIRLTLKNG